MRNDLYVKVTCINNDGIDEFHFDYYTKEGNIVGTVAVTEKGKLGWAIWNNKYEDSILSTVSTIFGLKVENNLSFIDAAKEEVPMRWERAQDMIFKSGLIVNYKQNIAFSRTFKNGSRK